MLIETEQKNRPEESGDGKKTTSAGETLFMCPPDFFEVTYHINPWMAPDVWGQDSDNLARQAREQWDRLRETYIRLGHEVITMPAAKGLPDMVFTANSSIVLDGKALMARFCYKERQGEEAHYGRFFEDMRARGLIDEVVWPPEGIIFEGAGDAVWDPYRKFYWFGHSKRSSPKAAGVVAETYGVKVVPLEMVTDRFYHLDVALAPLTHGQAIYIPEAFSDEGRRQIVKEYGEENLVAATPEDMEGFAVNAVNLGDDIITAYMSETLRRKVEGWGYKVHVVPLTAFRLGGGGAFCLTLRMDNHR